MNTAKVPVFNKAGKIIGYVAANATSVGASKIAGQSCQFSKRFGVWGWVPA